MRRFRPGTYICHQGDPSPEIFFLVKGRIEIASFSPTGTRVLHATVDTPQFLGELGRALAEAAHQHLEPATEAAAGGPNGRLTDGWQEALRRRAEGDAFEAPVRKLLGDSFPLMVDANQQWDRPTAQRMCRVFEDFNLVWIEEPLDAYDHEGHAALAAQFDTPIATGEMLTSAAEHGDLIRHRAADYLMPDAPRVGGITPFLKVAAQAEQAGLMLAPHFAMELHVHLAAAYPREPWVEHFEWLEPLFNERIEIANGRMVVPTRPGLGLSLSEQARRWTREEAQFGTRAV